MHVIGTIYTLYNRRAGVELYFERVLRCLSSLNKYKIFVFCNDEAHAVLTELAFANVLLVKTQMLNNQYSKALWLECYSKRAIQELRINLFWIPSGTNHFPGKYSIPTVVTFHDFGELHIKQKYDFTRTFYRKHVCIKRSINRATVLTSISETTRRDIKEYYGKDSEMIYSGPSPHDLNEMDRFTAFRILKNETRFDLTKDFYIAIGRTDYIGKGLDVLLKAHQSVNADSRARNLNLILCGPAGEDHEKFLNHLHCLDPDRVQYLGRVSNDVLTALYCTAKFVVFPSRFEGFGFPVLEAYQHKVPIIVSNGGSLPEIAGNGALIFNVGDSAELTEKIVALYSNQDIQNNLVFNGQVELKKYSWEITKSKMEALFDAVLAT